MNNGTSSNIGTNMIIMALGTALMTQIGSESYSSISPSLNVEYFKVLDIKSWEKDFELSENTDFSNFSAIQSFSEKLINNTQDIDNEILEVVNKNFWDLL